LAVADRQSSSVKGIRLGPVSVLWHVANTASRQVTRTLQTATMSSVFGFGANLPLAVL